MSLDLRQRLFDQLDQLTLIDPHTHINALDPSSHSLADILGYHYYTELAHSAGMPKDQIEEDGLDPKAKVGRLIENLGPIDNTIQHSWFVEMARALFGHDSDSIDLGNWESLYDAAERRMAQPNWSRHVLEQSKLEAVFLTNEFDDALEGFDTNVYVPCLRTDDLVFHLAKPQVRQRLERATGIAPSDARALRRAIGELFKHFKSRGARACAISLPPDFTPARVSPARANTALAAINGDGIHAAESHRRAIANYVFWTLAEMCDAFQLPFDLMIGVNRGVYAGGVHQGRDLYDSRVSLVQYKELLNAFPGVTFPISVLASVTNQELTSYAWIFPNVVTSGHWWYSNTPAYIEHDLAARLEAVPRTKQIGYYSDMYKLEFALPKFAMYKRVLAKVLAERFVIDRGWSEEKAVELGTQVLRGNVERIFRWGEDLRNEMPADDALDPVPAPIGPITDFGADVAAEDAGYPGMAIRSSTPLSGSLGIAGYSEKPPEALRAPDEEVVIPVPQEEETAEDDGSFDLGEGSLDPESTSAAGIGRAQPPSLEIVSAEADELDLVSPQEMNELDLGAAPADVEEDLQLLDAAELAELPPGDIEEAEVQELSLEEAEEEPDEQSRTDSFPAQPKKDNPGPHQDQWGFLGGK
jgi:glucuronate isomerase